MKALTTVAMYGLVPVPATHDTHEFRDSDNQPSVGDDANAALLAWYRHLAAKDELARALRDLEDLPAQQTATKSSRADALGRAPAARS
jgi:hypothetical protein